MDHVLESKYLSGHIKSPRYKVGDLVITNEFIENQGFEILKGTRCRVVGVENKGCMQYVKTDKISAYSFRFNLINSNKIKIKTKKVYI